uniref:Uncharacterized protein n=1 Tax=Cucumis sativus TaxID=3659 RepID=A0A0A0L8N2_CUCSA
MANPLSLSLCTSSLLFSIAPLSSSSSSKSSLFLSLNFHLSKMIHFLQLKNPILQDTHFLDPPPSSSPNPNGIKIKGGRPHENPSH